MDLAPWLRQGRVRGLLDLIVQLPAASRYWSAVAQDDDVAAALLAEQDARRAAGDDVDAREPWAPPLEQWDLTAQQLSVLINEVKALRQTTISAAGGRARAERPFPSPRTALAAAEARRDEQYAEDIGARFGF